MRILLGNNTLSLLAGTETWTMTLAKELARRGHTVHCFSPKLGMISDDLAKSDILSFDSISESDVAPFSIIYREDVSHHYDVIIANHHHIVDELRMQFPDTPIISAIHGIIHFLEDGRTMAPEHPALDARVDRFIAVSEEIKDKLARDYSVDSFIIRNFIDTKKFSAKKRIHDRPEQIFVNTNYADKDDPSIVVLREVAKHFGAKLVAVGQNFSLSTDIVKAIEDSDIVVGMGRSVLEGLSMGRIGIVHGRWGTAGIITEENIAEMRKYNFSGRNSNGELMTKDELVAQIDALYNHKNAEWGASYVRSMHNVAFAVDTIIHLAKDIIQNRSVATDTIVAKPYRRSSDVRTS